MCLSLQEFETLCLKQREEASEKSNIEDFSKKLCLFISIIIYVIPIYIFDIHYSLISI